MKTIISKSFSVQQLTAVVKYQSFLRDKFHRRITFAEALVYWIALGHSEKINIEHYLEEN